VWLASAFHPVGELMKCATYAWGVLWWLLFVPAPASASVSVIDDTGRTIELAHPARRIVSLAPHVTEMIFAAGAGERLVGTVRFSDFPPAAKRVPRVGGYAGFDLEAILALRPDLVIGWPSGNPGAQLDKLKEVGVPVYLSDPRHVDDVAATIERLGVLAGTSAAALREAAALRAGFARLRARHREKKVVRVFYEVWDDPLYTVNGEHIISDVIRLCGGRNVFADLPSLAPHVDVEAVLNADPDVIVASGMAGERPEWLDRWRKWPQLSAVQHHRLYVIHPDIIQRASPRLLDGAREMCRALDSARR
jgi:iron complex transport system substrate-binding protein